MLSALASTAGGARTAGSGAGLGLRRCRCGAPWGKSAGECDMCDCEPEVDDRREDGRGAAGGSIDVGSSSCVVVDGDGSGSASEKRDEDAGVEDASERSESLRCETERCSDGGSVGAGSRTSASLPFDDDDDGSLSSSGVGARQLPPTVC